MLTHAQHCLARALLHCVQFGCEVTRTAPINTTYYTGAGAFTVRCKVSATAYCCSPTGGRRSPHAPHLPTTPNTTATKKRRGGSRRKFGNKRLGDTQKGANKTRKAPVKRRPKLTQGKRPGAKARQGAKRV